MVKSQKQAPSTKAVSKKMLNNGAVVLTLEWTIVGPTMPECPRTGNVLDSGRGESESAVGGARAPPEAARSIRRLPFPLSRPTHPDYTARPESICPLWSTLAPNVYSCCCQICISMK